MFTFTIIVGLSLAAVRPPEPGAAIHNSRFLREAGHVDDALNLVRGSLRAHTESTALHLEYLEFLRTIEQTPVYEAEYRALRKALGSTGDLPLAAALIRIGEITKSNALLNEASSILGGLASPLGWKDYLLGNLARARGEKTVSLGYFRSAYRSLPDEERIAIRAFDIALSSMNCDELAAIATKAIAREPRSGAYMLEVLAPTEGSIMPVCDKGFELGLSLVERALRDSPEDGPLLAVAYRAFAATGSEKAGPLLERILRLRPSWSEAPRSLEVISFGGAQASFIEDVMRAQGMSPAAGVAYLRTVEPRMGHRPASQKVFLATLVSLLERMRSQVNAAEIESIRRSLLDLFPGSESALRDYANAAILNDNARAAEEAATSYLQAMSVASDAHTLATSPSAGQGIDELRRRKQAFGLAALGWARHHQGDGAMALRNLRLASLLLPDDALIARWLAVVEIAAGQNEEALRHIPVALSLPVAERVEALKFLEPASKALLLGNLNDLMEAPHRAITTSVGDHPRVGTNLPESVTIELLESGTVKLSDYHEGKAIALGFWAAYCMPCFAEMKVLQALPEVVEGAIRVLMLSVEEVQSGGSTRERQSRNMVSVFRLD